MVKPIIAITMGDAAGIGPELVVRVLAQPETWEGCCPLVVGDPAVLECIRQVVGADIRFRLVTSPGDARFALPEVDVLRPEGLRVKCAIWGQLDPELGRAAGLCLERALALAGDGRVQGILSAPLNKEAFHRAGYPHLDELSFMADLTGSRETFTLGAVGAFWTTAVAEHVAFRSIPDLIRKDRVLATIGRLHQALRKVGLAAPRLAVAALNPHAGEGGILGREELDEIGPAIADARHQGLDVHGPVPADAIFLRALAGEFDGVVCMYHDQANIARKLLARRAGATIFMGLTVVCTTTAHGTAFDIAGKGVADPGSMQAALRYAVLLSAR